MFSFAIDSQAAGALGAPAAAVSPQLAPRGPAASSEDGFHQLVTDLSDSQDQTADAKANAANASKADGKPKTEGQKPAAADASKASNSDDASAPEKAKSETRAKSCDESTESSNEKSAKAKAKKSKNAAEDAAIITPASTTVKPSVSAVWALLAQMSSGSTGKAERSDQSAAGHGDQSSIDSVLAGKMPAADLLAAIVAKRAQRQPATGAAADAHDAIADAVEALKSAASLSGLETSDEIPAGFTAATTATKFAIESELRLAAGVAAELRAALRGAPVTENHGGSADAGDRQPSRNSTSTTANLPFKLDTASVESAVNAARAVVTHSLESLVGTGRASSTLAAARAEGVSLLSLDHDQINPMSQIVQSVRLQHAQGGGDIDIKLQPTYLGELSVNVKVDRDVVSASMVAASPAVREWLRSNEGMLRQALADQGLRLDKLHIADPASETPDRETESRDRSAKRDQSQSRQPRRDPASSTSTFEVIAE